MENKNQQSGPQGDLKLETSLKKMIKDPECMKKLYNHYCDARDTIKFRHPHLPEEELRNYLTYWKELWKVHPLNRSDRLKEVFSECEDSAADETFDWARFVTMKDLVLKFSLKGKLVSANKPRTIPQMRVGGYRGCLVNQPYCTYFEGKYEHASPDEVYVETFDTVKYDPRTHHKFTIGNFEAALRITRPIWKERLYPKGAKRNWEYVITPICYEFLVELDREITGYNKDWFEEFENYSSVSKELEKSYIEHHAVIAEHVNPEETVHPLEVTTPWQSVCEILPETYECWMPTICEQPIPERVQDNPEEKPKYRRKTVTDFRWYPKYEAFHDKKQRKSRMKTITEVSRSYFDDLHNVYMRIGRPDLAVKIKTDVRINWLRAKIWNAYVYDPYGRFIPKRCWKAQADCENKCAKSKYREKIYRMIDQYKLLLTKHRDKMEVLSHRGRFVYLKTWDLGLYEKQRRVLSTIDTQTLNHYMMTSPQREVDIVVPRSYVEQADGCVRLCARALEDRTELKLIEAIKALIWIKTDWQMNTFDPKRTVCLQAQGDSAKGNVKSTAGGSGSSALPAKSSAQEVDKPVTSGETKVTMTNVDQREVVKAEKDGGKKKPEKPSAASELQYTINDMFKRPMFIDRVTWSTGDEIGKELKQWVIPDVYFSADEKKPTACQNFSATYLLACFGAMSFKSMKAEIRINTQTMNCGYLIMYFKPYYDISRKYESFHNVMQYPHVLIDASVSNSAELNMSWMNPRDLFPLYTDPHQEINYVGTLHLAVWNPLGVGKTGSSDASVSLWLSLNDVRVVQLTNPKDPGNIHFASTIRGGPSLEGGDTEHMLGREYKRITQVEHWEAQGLMEDIISEGSQLVKDMGTEVVENALHSVIGAGALSKPHMTMPPQPVTIISSQNPSLSEGPDTAQTLSLYGKAIKPLSSDLKPITSVRDYLREWSRVRIITQTTQDAENTSLLKLPVTPMLNAVTSTQDKTLHTKYSVVTYDPEKKECGSNVQSQDFMFKWRNGTMMDYMARGFLGFTGDIDIMFDAATTKGLHSTRWYIRTELFGNDYTADNECQKIATPGVVWDIREDKKIIITVPYNSTQPLLTTDFVSDGAIHSEAVTQTSLGILECSVLNRLKVTTGISDSIQVNVYMRAGKNFEFAFLRPLNGLWDIRSWVSLDSTWGKETNSIYVAFVDIIKKLRTRLLAKPAIDAKIASFTSSTGEYLYYDDGYNFPFTTDIENHKTDYLTWVKRIYDTFKSRGTTNFYLPEFHDIQSAYRFVKAHWLTQDNELGSYYRDRFQTNIPREIRQKQIWWLACVLMKEHAWDIKYVPKFTPDKPCFVALRPKKHWTAQAKTTEKVNDLIKALNPFKDFSLKKPSVKEQFGEDFMDMYAHMKRYQQAFTLRVPPNITSDSVGEQTKLKFFKLFKELVKMTPVERENFFFEVEIPVTPAVDFEKVGDANTAFSKTGNGQLIGDTANVFGTTGANVGNFSNITSIQFYGEVSSMYSGGIKYGINMLNSVDQEGRPWTMYAIYHPRHFSGSWAQAMGSTSIVTKNRIRELSRMGYLMFTGTSMQTLYIKVPYYSKYSQLAYSRAIIDETTSMGTLLLYIPVRLSDISSCEVDTFADFSKLNLSGPMLDISMAVADDFRYYGMRAAPPQVLWSPYYNMQTSWGQRDDGWDATGSGGGASKRIFPDLYSVDVSLGDEGKAAVSTRGNPIKSFAIMVENKYERTLTPTMTTEWQKKLWATDLARGDLNLVRTMADIPEEDEKDEPEGPKISERKWEMQADDEPVSTEQQTEHTGDIEVPVHDEIDGFFSGMTNTMKDFRESVATATGVLQTLADAAVTVSKNSEKVSEAVASTSNTISTTTKYVYNSARIGVFFWGIKSLLEAETWKDRMIPLSSCALALGLSPEVVTKAGEWLVSSVSTLFGSEKVHENRQAQAYEDIWDQDWMTFVNDNANLFRFIAAGIVTILTFYMTSSAPMASKVQGFSHNMLAKLRNFAIVGTALKTLDWMWKWVGDVIKTAALTIGDWVSGGLITSRRMINHYPEVVNWMRNVEYYQQESAMMCLTWNSDERLRLWSLMDKGEEMINKISSKGSSLYNTLSRGMLALQRAHDRTMQTRSTVPFRIDPFHVCLVGASGVGKSSLLVFLLNFLAEQQGWPKKHRFWSRCEEDEYWTNYNGQPIVIIDDIFSDKKGKAIKELIKMKTNLAFALNMANVEEKGRCFMSQLIGSTTNTKFPKPDDITHYSAIWRRRNALVEVRAPGIREQGVAPSWEALRFDILNPDPRHGETEVFVRDLTLDKLLVILATQMNGYLNDQRALVFSGLQGKTITMPDYGDDLLHTVDTPISTVVQEWLSCDARGIKYSPEFLMQSLGRLKKEEITELLEDDRYLAFLQKYDLVDSARYFRALKQLEGMKTNYQEWTDVTPELMELKQANYLTATDDVFWTPFVSGECKAREYGYLRLDKSVENKLRVKWTSELVEAQADEMDMLIEDLGNIDESITRANELQRKAATSIEERGKLMQGFQEMLYDQTRRKRIKKTFVMQDREEIRKYVDEMFINQGIDKEAIVKDVEEIFNWATNDAGLVKANALNHDFAELFSKEHMKMWKKENGHWKMEFPEAGIMDEKTMDLSTLYDFMVDKWTPEEIDKHREACQDPEKNSSTVAKLIAFSQAQTKKISDWMQEHKTIVTMIRVGLSIAAIFAGYKILYFVCPGVFESIKNLVYKLFGWTKEKIGPERVDRVISKGREIKDNIKQKAVDSYEWVRQLMRGNDNADVVRAAEDDEAVKFVAESLPRHVKNVTNNLLMHESVVKPEGLARKRVNAYMLGQPNLYVEVEDKVTKKQYQAQGSSDLQATKLRSEVLIKNMCRLAWSNDKRAMSLSGIFIEGRNLLVPGHFFTGMEEGQLFCITLSTGVDFWQAFNSASARKLKGIDAVVYACTPRVGQFRKIVQHFLPAANLKFRKVPATLNILSSTLALFIHPTTAELVTEVNYNYQGETIKNSDAWEYSASTSTGDCGAILLADSTSVQTKILGIHVCGAEKENYGSSAFVSQEALVEAIKDLPDWTGVKFGEIAPLQWITKPVEDMKIQPQGNFEYIGAVSPSKAVRLPHKTEIEKSPIFDLVREHTSEPAVLTSSDPRNISGNSPLKLALAKYGSPTLPFNPTRLKYVVDDLLTEVKTWQCPMGKRKLSDHEAVFGNEMIEYCDRMNLGASPGYPYTLSRPSGEKGKVYLYDYNAEDGIADEEYRHAYRSREVLAKAGLRKVSVWTDCLKDERRPIAKIAAGKTRAFMLPPADFVQLCRKYFMSFCVAFYSNKIKSFSAVGIDPYSFDWTRLTRKLRRKSNLGFGGDFHSFDGIFDPEFMYWIGWIINQWYASNPDEDFEEEDQKVRMVLIEEMIHTVHICLDSVYRKFQGNPSGNPLTVIVNTFAHCMYIRLAWFSLAEQHEPELASMYRFHQFVSETYYGDDGLYAVKYEVKDWFNLQTVSEFLFAHKIEYTSESKDDDLYGVRQVTKCTFLKNGFSKLEGKGLWLAPISQDTIFELTNWIRKSDDPLAQLRENLENAMKFAFHHGKDFYESFCLRVNTALRARGLREIATSYALQEEMFMAKCRA